MVKLAMNSVNYHCLIAAAHCGSSEENICHSCHHPGNNQTHLSSLLAEKYQLSCLLSTDESSLTGSIKAGTDPWDGWGWNGRLGHLVHPLLTQVQVPRSRPHSVQSDEQRGLPSSELSAVHRKYLLPFSGH